MKMQISELAALMGISVRTLQYYDRIGLLKPAEIGENGYRLYDEASAERLRKILHYKNLDFSLKDISLLLSEEKIAVRTALTNQRLKLAEKKRETERLISSLDNELAKPVAVNGMFDIILERYGYSGFTYGNMLEREKTMFFSWGKADFEEDKSFTVSSKFCIRSLTTQFTAFCTLLLYELGQLDIYQSAAAYLPEFVHGEKIKIIHLLNMTSGISPDNSITHKAGEHFAYSDHDYELLGKILEGICKKPLSDIYSEYIFTPLEMNDTCLGGNYIDIFGYLDNNRTESLNPVCGAYGIISTAEDMGKWYTAIIDKKLLTQKGYDILLDKNDFGFSCGFYGDDEGKYSHFNLLYEVAIETQIDIQKGTFGFTLRNKAPVPENKARVMFFPIRGCDDGKAKFEVWEMEPDSFVRVFSLKIYDEAANELFSVKADAADYEKYIINVFNNGEKRHASEFAESYYYEIDLSEICEAYSKDKTYFAELTSECACGTACAQLGIVYRQAGEWVCSYYNVFYQHESAYALFLEALNNTCLSQ